MFHSDSLKDLKRSRTINKKRTRIDFCCGLILKFLSSCIATSDVTLPLSIAFACVRMQLTNGTLVNRA